MFTLLDGSYFAWSVKGLHPVHHFKDCRCFYGGGRLEVLWLEVEMAWPGKEATWL